MFLPGFLALILLTGLQDPDSGSWTVSAGGGAVAEPVVAAVRADVDPALADLRRLFPGLPQQSFRIFVHAGADDLPAPLRPMHHPGSPGFAIPARHEIHLLLAEIRGTGRGIRPVLVHELTHELLHQWCDPWGDRLPRWFHEGLAQVVAGDTYLGASEEMIVWRAATSGLLHFSELNDGFPTDTLGLRIAYAQSHSYVAWLAEHIGRNDLVRMVRRIDRDLSFNQALVLETHLSTADLEGAWQRHLLQGSGAQWRVLLQQFFSVSMVLALPLLALALIRRLRVDRRARERLDRAEQMALETSDPPALSGDPMRGDESRRSRDPVLGPAPPQPPGRPQGPS